MRYPLGLCRAKKAPKCHLTMKKYYTKQNYRKVWEEILHKAGLDKCSKCGYDKCFYAIDYHHTSDVKEESASALFAKKPTEERIGKFIASIKSGLISVLCATHHREEHFKVGRVGRKPKQYN